MNDTRHRVLRAAGPIFAEKGFEAATIREICQVADVNIAAVNYHFGNKERLYIETVRWAHRPTDEVEPELDWPAGTPAEQKLREYIEGMLHRMLAERASWQRKLVMREMLQPSVACRELVRLDFGQRYRQLLEILDEMLPSEMPLHKRQQVGFSIVGQGLYYHVGREVVRLLIGEADLASHYSQHALAEHIVEFTFAALGLGAPLNEARPPQKLLPHAGQEPSPCPSSASGEGSD